MIYYCNEINELQDDLFDSLLHYLPQERQMKIIKMKKKEHQRQSLVAYWLLVYALHKISGSLIRVQFEYTKYHRPILKDIKLKFSFTHSGNFVACAISENEIGIDAQKVTECTEGMAKLVLGCLEINEWKRLTNKNDKDEYFTAAWTKKESVLKYKSLGLQGNLKELELGGETGILSDQRTGLFIETKRQSDLFLSICSEKSYHVFNKVCMTDIEKIIKLMEGAG